MNDLAIAANLAGIKRHPWSLGRFLILTNTLAWMSLKAEASRLYLSYVWWLVEPLLYVLVFYVVFDRLLGVGGENFLLFLLCGKLPYLWFSRSVTVASDSILHNCGLIEQMDIPKLLFPLVAVLEGLYRQGPVFILLLLLAAFFHGMQPAFTWLWLLPVILVQLLLIICSGLLATLLVTYIRDMRLVINLLMTFLMFTSGIFYNLAELEHPFLRELLLIGNPLAFLIISYRQVLMFDTAPDLLHLLLLAAGLLVCLLLLCLLYHLLNRRLATEVLR